MKTTINGFNIVDDFNELIKEVREQGCGGYNIPRGDFYEYIFVTNNIPAPVWHVLPAVCDCDNWSPESKSGREIIERLKTLEESQTYRKMQNLLVVKFNNAYRAYDFLTLEWHEFTVTAEMGIKWSHDLVLRECERRR